jgi:glycosyltransferase involved in cell wall biosynthesis
MAKRISIGVIGLKGLPAFGGAATVGENSIKHLQEIYDFTVYSVSSHTKVKGKIELYNQFVIKKIPLRRINVLYYYLMSSLHALFFGKYDIIHLHHIDGAFILPLLRLKYKVIGTMHARPQINKKWPGWVNYYFRINEFIFIKLVNQITVVSKPLEYYLTGRTNKKIFFIPNGGFFSELIIPNQTGESYILFAAGRIIPIKGCHFFLEALHKLNYKGNVVIIGDLEQNIKYKKQILSLAKGLDVKFINLIKDKFQLYSYLQNSKLFVFPSTTETMSTILFEAVSLKCRIVCSDIIENRYILNEDEVLFFKSEDTSDLTLKIKYALQNPDELSLRAEKAFERLKKIYSWQRVAEEYNKQYQLMSGLSA